MEKFKIMNTYYEHIPLLYLIILVVYTHDVALIFTAMWLQWKGGKIFQGMNLVNVPPNYRRVCSVTVAVCISIFWSVLPE